MTLTIDLQDLAKQAAGNWQHFESFAWHRKPKNAQDWTIVYTSHRDSTLISQSNANAIDELLLFFLLGDDPDVVAEQHSHWAVGYVNGYSIRVYHNRRITKAFAKWCEIQGRLQDYPVLDDDDYSAREKEATIANIKDQARYLAGKWDIDLPDGYQYEIYVWLLRNDENALENRDDQGAYPNDTSLLAAFTALGYE